MVRKSYESNLIQTLPATNKFVFIIKLMFPNNPRHPRSKDLLRQPLLIQQKFVTSLVSLSAEVANFDCFSAQVGNLRERGAKEFLLSVAILL